MQPVLDVKFAMKHLLITYGMVGAGFAAFDGLLNIGNIDLMLVHLCIYNNQK